MFTDITTGPIIWTIINFIILLALLAKLGWKPITEALAKREQAINDAVQQAEKARADAEKMITNRAVMAKAEGEAQELLAKAANLPTKSAPKRAGKADQEARVLIERAKSEIERSKKEALNQLRAEVANLAVNASERILKEQIDRERGERLVASYLAEATEVSAN